MKKIIYITIALSMLVYSCSDLLDTKPTDAIASDDAISNKSGIEKAITGSYDALQYASLYGRNLVILGDLAADNLVWTGTTYDYYEIENNDAAIDNGIIEGMWSVSYDGINRVNNVLAAIPGIGDMTDAERNKYEGEARFLRALNYFNLLTLFGGVPIVTTPTLSLDDIDRPRNSENEVYGQIIADLEAAEQLLPLPGQAVSGRANKFSATALLARVYLTRFHANGNADDANAAIAKAQEVIDNGGFSLVSPYSALYTGDNSETIFQVVFSVQDRNRLSEYFYPRSLTGRYEIAPSAALMDSYTPQDSERYQATIAVDTEGKVYGNKYQDLSTGADAVLVLRLAEMHLIIAEALAFTNGAVDRIQQNINAVRSRAGLAPVNDTGIPELIIAIAEERRHEFALEGHRWFDLVRTKTATVVLGITENQTLFPIPLSEMSTNSKMEQNPGY